MGGSISVWLCKTKISIYYQDNMNETFLHQSNSFSDFGLFTHGNIRKEKMVNKSWLGQHELSLRQRPKVTRCLLCRASWHSESQHTAPHVSAKAQDSDKCFTWAQSKMPLYAQHQLLRCPQANTLWIRFTQLSELLSPRGSHALAQRKQGNEETLQQPACFQRTGRSMPWKELRHQLTELMADSGLSDVRTMHSDTTQEHYSQCMSLVSY